MSETRDEASGLKRHFGFWTAVFLVVASMIGSGVLTSTGFLLQRIPDMTIVMILWAIGGCVALCGALTMAEMATAFPEVGGDYVYVREAFGARMAYTYGCAMVILGFAVPVAMVAYTLGSLVWSYVERMSLFAGIDAHLFCLVFAALSILTLTLIHVRGHEESAAAQSISTTFKILVFVAFIALGLNSQAGSWSHFEAAKEPVTLSSFAANLILVMYAYTGWNGSVYIAGEMKNPGRNLTWSLVLGTTLVTLLYLGLNLVYGYAINPTAVATLSDNDVTMYAETANKALFEPPLARAFSVLIGLGVIASLSSFIMTGPRIVYAMAQDGLVPMALGRACERTRIPKTAIWFLCVLSLVLLFTNSFQFLLDFAGYGLGVIALFIILPIFWLRRRPSYKPTFIVPLYPWLPALFLMVNVAMLVVGATETPRAALTSLVTISIPFIVYPWIKSFPVAPAKHRSREGN